MGYNLITKSLAFERLRLSSSHSILAYLPHHFSLLLFILTHFSNRARFPHMQLVTATLGISQTALAHMQAVATLPLPK